MVDFIGTVEVVSSFAYLSVDGTAYDVSVDDSSVLDEVVWVSVLVAYSPDDPLSVVLAVSVCGPLVVISCAVVELPEDNVSRMEAVVSPVMVLFSVLVGFTWVVACTSSGVALVTVPNAKVEAEGVTSVVVEAILLVVIAVVAVEAFFVLANGTDAGVAILAVGSLVVVDAAAVSATTLVVQCPLEMDDPGAMPC